jgi:hypothetical protein
MPLGITLCVLLSALPLEAVVVLHQDLPLLLLYV